MGRIQTRVYAGRIYNIDSPNIKYSTFPPRLCFIWKSSDCKSLWSEFVGRDRFGAVCTLLYTRIALSFVLRMNLKASTGTYIYTIEIDFSSEWSADNDCKNSNITMIELRRDYGWRRSSRCGRALAAFPVTRMKLLKWSTSDDRTFAKWNESETLSTIEVAASSAGVSSVKNEKVSCD